jgi:hypothetical protein
MGEAGNANVRGVGGIKDAGTVCGAVGSVIRLEVGMVSWVVGKRAGLPATVATIAGLNTIDELLLREGEELTGSDLVSTFEGTS